MSACPIQVLSAVTGPTDTPARPVTEGEQAGLLLALTTVPDPRSPRGLRYPLAGLLTVAVCAVLAGASSVTAIADWLHPQLRDPTSVVVLAPTRILNPAGTRATASAMTRRKAGRSRSQATRTWPSRRRILGRRATSVRSVLEACVLRLSFSVMRTARRRPYRDLEA
jgi:hypothetical protein